MTAAPLSIVELRASNVKRLVAVTIRPDEHGNMVVLSGSNGAGKSSVLDAIAMALGGGDQIPAEPIRRGQDHAEVVVDLGELVVRRTFTPSGGGSLVVANKDGARFQSPQTMLNAFVGKLTFDPLEFSRQEPKRQAETLRSLLGLDFSTFDHRRETLYVDRTAVNKQAASLRARFEAMPKHEDAPADPVSVADLAEELRVSTTANAENAKMRDESRARANIAEGRAQLAEATRAKIAELQRVLEAQVAEAKDAEAKAEACAMRAAAATDVDTAPLIEQMRAAEGTNRKVRENHKRTAVAAEYSVAEAESQRLTEAIAAVDQQKADAIASAAMPVPGLGFSTSGTVTLNDLPLDQASAAEKLRVSIAIAVAMNPRLRVILIRDASLLDAESLRLVAEMARTAGCQLWVERVETDNMTTVVIEDGNATSVNRQEASL